MLEFRELTLLTFATKIFGMNFLTIRLRGVCPRFDYCAPIENYTLKRVRVPLDERTVDELLTLRVIFQSVVEDKGN